MPVQVWSVLHSCSYQIHLFTIEVSCVYVTGTRDSIRRPCLADTAVLGICRSVHIPLDRKERDKSPHSPRGRSQDWRQHCPRRSPPVLLHTSTSYLCLLHIPTKAAYSYASTCYDLDFDPLQPKIPNSKSQVKGDLLNSSFILPPPIQIHSIILN